MSLESPAEQAEITVLLASPGNIDQRMTAATARQARVVQQSSKCALKDSLGGPSSALVRKKEAAGL